MQLLSRIMGLHKLCVLGFYTYIVKYLFHKQLRIPAILASLAQSVHDLTPPDALTPVIRKLAQEFVHPGVANEVIAAGINSIREVCRRQPWAMEEDLLSDLIEYRKSRDKQVIAASRGLLRLYREVNPGMLKKRERVSCSPSLSFRHLLNAVCREKKPRWLGWLGLLNLCLTVMRQRQPWTLTVLRYVHHSFRVFAVILHFVTGAGRPPQGDGRGQGK
jgi:hypothetical protein